MPPKKKVKKPPVKQKQKQSQSQKVIINLQDVKKTKSTRRKPVKKQTEQNIIPRGWNVYSTPDRREIDEIRGQLINVQNKLVNPKPLKNEVGRQPVKYYSREDNIGDFSNKMKFEDNEKKEQEKQSRNLQGFLLKEKQKKPILKELKKRNPKRTGRPGRNPLILNPISKDEEEEKEEIFRTITQTQFL